MSTRVLCLILAVILGGTGPARALEWMYVALQDNTVVRFDVSLGNSTAVAGSANVFINTNLNNPWGLAFASNGDMLVANGGGSTISRYGTNGVFKSSISGNMNFPVGLAIDTSGSIYTANFSGNNVSKFNSDGTFNQSITGSLTVPYGVALNSAGRVYVANNGTGTGTNTVAIFDSSGVSQGTVSTNVNRPTGVTFDKSGNLYVGNNGNNTVTKYDSSNNWVSTISTNVASPRGLATDSAGNLYVANATGNTISKFDSNGGFQFAWALTTGPRMMIVPEPSTYVLATIGTIGIGMMARRRKSRPNSSMRTESSPHERFTTP